MKNVVVLFFFVFPLLFFIEPSTVNAASGAPNWKVPHSCFNSKALCLDIPGPLTFFRGLPNSNVTTRYVFTNFGIDFWYDSTGSNVSASAITAKWGTLSNPFLLIPSGSPVAVNGSTIAQGFKNSLLTGSNTASVTLYFKQVVVGGYISHDLKVSIVYSFSSPNAVINMSFLNILNKPKTCTATRLTFGSTGYDSSDSASMGSFNCSTNTLTFPNLPSSGVIDPATIGTSTNSVPTEFDYQEATCNANTKYWVFYFDGVSEGFRTSSDGTTWSVETTFTTSATVAAGREAFHCSGTKLYYAFDSVSTTVYYRSFTMNTDGTLTADFNEASFTTTNTATYPSVTLDSSGNLWVATQSSTGTDTHGEFWKCAAPIATCTWAKSKDVDAATATVIFYKITGLTSGRMSVVWGVTTYSGVLTGMTFDGSSTWSSSTNTAGTAYSMTASSCVAITDTTHCATSDNTNVFYVSLNYNSNSPTWNSATNLGAGIYATIATDGTSCLSIPFLASATTMKHIDSCNSGSSFGSAVSLSTSESSASFISTGASIVSATVTAAWVSGSGPNYNVRFAKDAVSVSEQVAITMSPVGASSQTVTITAPCSVASIVADGTQKTFTCIPSTSITFTVPSATGTNDWQFSNAGSASTTWAYTTAASGTDTQSNTLYYRDKLTSSYSGTVAASGAPSLQCTLLGVASTKTALTTTPTTGYCDDGVAYVIFKPTADFPSASERYDTNFANGTSSGGATVNPAFYHQYMYTLSYSVTGGGSPTAPALTSTQFGGSYTPTLAQAATGYWLDNSASCSSTNPTTGSTSLERWDTNTTCPTVSAAQTIVLAYYHQYAITISYSLSDSSTPTAPSLTGKRFGSATSDTLTKTATAVWQDNSAALTTANPLSGSSTTQRWVAPSGTSLTVSAAATLAPAYYHQYSMQNAGALSITRTNNASSATTTSTSFWADVTSQMTVSGTYPYTVRVPTFQYFIYQENSQGLGVLSNAALTNVLYAQNPNRLTYVGSASTNATVYEANALQNSIGGVSKFFSNGNSITTYAWSASTGLFVSGTVSCTTNCEVDFVLGGGTSSSGGNIGTGTVGTTTPSSGGGGGGGGGCPVNFYMSPQGACLPVPTNPPQQQQNSGFAPVGNVDQLAIGLTSLLGFLLLLGVVRYATKETALDKLKAPNTKVPRVKSPKLPMLSIKVKHAKRMP